jgi:predicted RNase H-like HicB family nuclease
MTQAETERQAMESLREAVELWFESCISRNVLDEALVEAGFN